MKAEQKRQQMEIELLKNPKKMCEILKINRTAYYKWKNHRNSENDKLNEQIADTALKIHEEHPDM